MKTLTWDLHSNLTWPGHVARAPRIGVTDGRNARSSTYTEVLPLTYSNLRKFTTMGPYSVEESPSKETLSTTSSGFQKITLDNGILDRFMSAEAIDKEEIVKILAQLRPSSPPPLEMENWKN